MESNKQRTFLDCSLGSVVAIYGNIFVAEIAEPVNGLLPGEAALALFAAAKVNDNLQIFVLQNGTGTSLVNFLRLAIDEELEDRGSIHGLEAHACPLRHDNAGLDALCISNGA